MEDRADKLIRDSMEACGISADQPPDANDSPEDLVLMKTLVQNSATRRIEFDDSMNLLTIFLQILPPKDETEVDKYIELRNRFYDDAIGKIDSIVVNSYTAYNIVKARNMVPLMEKMEDTRKKYVKLREILVHDKGKPP
jgi:uncharacterized protein YutE (UPF0331/DUF86 family)